MNNFCLLPEKVEQFKKALKEKEIKIADLLNMSTEARIELLKKYAGEAATEVNALFEKKLVLKNRMMGIKNWASKVGEIGRYSPEGKAKLQKAVEEYRKRQMERILNPKENEAFLQTLADKAVGTEVTREEAKQVFELSAKVEDLRKNFDGKKWSSEQDRLDYGAAKVQLENYTAELKGETEPLKEMIKGKVEQFKKDFAENPSKAIVNTGVETLKTISDNAIALVASVDNSFLGRQGLKTLQTHPTAWWSGAKNSFIDIFKEIGGKNAMDALMADIYSQPRHMTGEYQKAEIIPKTEEQFPASLPEKIPGLGRLFKASEVAFKGSAARMRMKLYDLVADMAENNKVKMDDKQIKDIGTIINSLTARGKWGKYGESPIVKLIFWAPRMIKANLDVLTVHGFGSGLETSFAKKEAAKNLLKIVGAYAVIGAIIYSINKDAIGTEETSADFGKLKVADTQMNRILSVLADFVGLSSQTYGGKTRIDLTGGLGTYITLASRLLEKKTTSATTGITTPLGSGYGQTSQWDVVLNFLTGKTAPAVSTTITYAKGSDFQGKKPTLGSTLERLMIPISIQNILNLNQQDETDWNQSTSKEMTGFKAKVGQKTFDKANQSYNEEYNKRFKRLVDSAPYKGMMDEDKQKAVTKLKNEVKNNIFKQYGYK